MVDAAASKAAELMFIRVRVPFRPLNKYEYKKLFESKFFEVLVFIS